VTMRSILLLTFVFLFTGGTVFAQADQQKQAEVKKSYLYKWIDDKGVSHITDGLGKVPKRYRDRAVQMESQNTDETPAVPQVLQGSGYSDQTEIDHERKLEWQDRMRDARKRLADAEQRYRELDRKRTEALEKWGGVASGHLEGREEANSIEQEMRQTQQEIDAARNQVENVIPDEARKAGVPPGWLRE
jgi:hypothetical protein